MKSFQFLLLLLLCGCNKCDDDNESPKLDFSCLKLYNDQGEDMGIHGCATSNDWVYNDLSESEEAYFLSNDTISLSGTNSANVSRAAAYPVPVAQGGLFHFQLYGPVGGGPVKLQLAIIDENKNVLIQHTLKVTLNQDIAIQVPADKFNRGQFYRVYYRASAQNSPIVFEGYGNIVVCKNPPVFDIDTDCI